MAWVALVIITLLWVTHVPLDLGIALVIAGAGGSGLCGRNKDNTMRKLGGRLRELSRRITTQDGDHCGPTNHHNHSTVQTGSHAGAKNRGGNYAQIGPWDRLLPSD